MDSLHLRTGSKKPAEVKGQARLYSMKYCPLAQRIRLILSYKKIPHNIVNIDITDIPEWYYDINPNGTVPTFVDADGTVIDHTESIANYLDKKHPEPPLYNEATKARTCELLNHYTKVVNLFANCINDEDRRPLNEITLDLVSVFEEFENELASCGTIFFGGTQPGMLDIMMWPWVERRTSLSLLYDEPMAVDSNKFPHMADWVQNMETQPFVKENTCCYAKFAQIIHDIHTGTVDFDKV